MDVVYNEGRMKEADTIEEELKKFDFEIQAYELAYKANILTEEEVETLNNLKRAKKNFMYLVGWKE